MSFFKYFTITFITFSTIACTDKSDTMSSLKIISNAKDSKISSDELLELKINNPKSITIDSVNFKLNNISVDKTVDLKNFKLGDYQISAIIYSGDEQFTKKKSLTILSNQTPMIYGFEVINTYPHDITSYTQGLEFKDGILYESTGQYGESKLRKINFKTAEVIDQVELDDQYFGEGLTILNDRIYQLTWQKKVGFIYDVNSLEKLKTFNYSTSVEGWGICNDGKSLYKSDGTEKIWMLDPETLTEESFIQAYTNKGKVVGLNELEWVNGKIYANRYQKDGVAIINPTNGAVIGVIDFSSLKTKVKQHPKLDVLNGIAWNSETQTLFVTGKRWDTLFEVKLIEN
jgi:glutamine cyclotransferase